MTRTQRARLFKMKSDLKKMWITNLRDNVLPIILGILVGLFIVHLVFRLVTQRSHSTKNVIKNPITQAYLK